MISPVFQLSISSSNLIAPSRSEDEGVQIDYILIEHGNDKDCLNIFIDKLIKKFRIFLMFKIKEFFSSVKEKLTESSTSIKQTVSVVLGGKIEIDEDSYEKITDALILSDISITTYQKN